MSPPKFCSNCGEKLDENLKIDECPKCHSALHEHSKHIESPSRVVEQLPYKSPGTAALIAFIGGIFALPGIGHIYVGKLGKGIAILVGGLVLYILAVLWLFSITSIVTYSSYFGASDMILPIVIVSGLSIGYIAFFVWQIFNARNLAKKFNELVKSTGKEPW